MVREAEFYFPCSAQAPPWAPSSTIPKGRNSSPGAAAAPVQQLGFGELHRQELMAELVQIQGINIKVWNFSGNHLSPNQKCQRFLWRGFAPGMGSTAAAVTVKPRLNSKVKPEHPD